MEQAGYCAFISYRHVSPDSEIAKKLHTAIETYAIPASVQKQVGKKRLGKAFRDEEELPLSSDLGADIEAALDKSEWFIAICSPRYLESHWCLREMEYFIEHKGRERVLTVLVEGEPKDSFPEMIRFTELENGEKIESEPLAANVRADSVAKSLQKLKKEKLRIFAPMLDISFDDLRQRAKLRRRRITAIATAAAVAVVAGVSIFLGFNHMRNEALKREAAYQAELAEERQKLADEQHRFAVYNEIGGMLERSDTLYTQNDRVAGAKTLLEALNVSEQNENARRDEIMARLKKMMYLTPFAPMSVFNNLNVSMYDIVPSPDGSKAIGVENRNRLAMIDFTTNEILYKVDGGGQLVVHNEFSPDGTRFLANYGTHFVIWDTETGEEVLNYRGKNGRDREISNVYFWKDSDTLLLQNWDQFYIVSLKDGSEKLIYTLGEHQEWYSRDVNLYTASTGRSLTELMTAHTDDYLSMQVIPSEDWSKILISGKVGENGTLLIDENGDFCSGLFSMPATFFDSYTLSPDGKEVACAMKLFGVVLLFDAENGDLLDLFEFPQADSFSVSELVFSPDSSKLAFVCNHTLYVIDARNPSIVYMTSELYETVYSPSVEYSRDGKFIMVTEQNLYVFDAETYYVLLFETAEEGSPYGNAIALNDTIFATKGNGQITIYSLPDMTSIRQAEEAPGELIERYYPGIAPDGAVEMKGEHEIIHGYWEQHSQLPQELLVPVNRYSKEGDTSAIVYPDGAIELFDTFGDGTVKETLSQLERPITAFGMVGGILAASDESGRMMFYDLKNKNVIRILNDGAGYIGFAYSADGTLLMALRTGSRVVDVFSMKTAEQLFSMIGPVGFTDFAFTADGAYAVGMMEDGTYLVGELFQSEEKLLQTARAFVGRYQ